MNLNDIYIIFRYLKIFNDTIILAFCVIMDNQY